jgi:precorrin-2 dehydrogenase/sirohydrochlorin ferrochelatase
MNSNSTQTSFIPHSSFILHFSRYDHAMSAYPLFLDLTDRLCVIIGGGVVATRKANGLLESGATRVRMIAPVFASDVPIAVEQVRETYRPDHLDGAGLVFAATNIPEINDAVVRDAKARGVLVSRADLGDDLPGDFHIPARFADGPITVAVSAASPALSVMIRDAIASQWNAHWTALAQAMIELRPEIKRSFDEPIRKTIFRDLATKEAMDVLASGGMRGLRDWVNRRHGEAS